MSQSMISTFIPCCAKVTARLAAVVVFPSFGEGLVTTMLRSDWIDCEKIKFVRSVRYASAPTDPKSVSVMSASPEYLSRRFGVPGNRSARVSAPSLRGVEICGITARPGIWSINSTSSRRCNVVLRRSATTAAPPPSMSPMMSPVKIRKSAPRPIGDSGCTARSTSSTCPTSTASEIRARWYSSRSWSAILRAVSTRWRSRASTACTAGSFCICAELRDRSASSDASRASTASTLLRTAESRLACVVAMSVSSFITSGLLFADDQPPVVIESRLVRS